MMPSLTSLDTATGGGGSLMTETGGNIHKLRIILFIVGVAPGYWL